jgi:acyl carrier protein
MPIANTRFYVLDENLRLVPPGVVGELHISGAGVGRGYLNNEELTKQKFILNPYADGERLYKTGDLVKRLEDGEIVYIGRIDNQVKVRGFRIEIGEIEAVLNQFSGIKEAVVILRDDISNEKELVAYLVVDSEWSSVGDEELSKEVLLYLRNQLPEYMLPSHFVKLERLPLTPNGKMDRKSLPRPDREARLNAQEYVAPVTEVEKKLSEIWSSVLGIEKVGLHDNFFDLGGNSILVMKLMFRIHHELQQDISMTIIFDHPKFSDFIQNIPVKEEMILDTVIEKESI